jgi:hypothetical protein
MASDLHYSSTFTGVLQGYIHRLAPMPNSIHDILQMDIFQRISVTCGVW